MGWLRGLLTAAGVTLLFLATAMGFGAVLLTQGGRRPEYHPLDPDEAWRQAVDEDAAAEAEAPAGAGARGTANGDTGGDDA